MTRHKVYISSTYSDLKEHRRKVIEFFGKKSVKENFEVISMEGYVADDTVPTLECLADVKICDIYILIIANRYGFIPSDSTINPEKLSITELEYKMAAADPQKKILVFFADEPDGQFVRDNDEDTAFAAEKKAKLDAFKFRIRQTRLTHPEPFISSYHLALQIAESLMKRSFIAYKLDESRKYCCDRVQQFTRFIQLKNTGFFRAFFIHGQKSELGLNLIHRFSIFTLNLTEADIVPPLTFEEILGSERYEQNRTDLLAFIYFKLFNSYNMEDLSSRTFLTAINACSKPLVFVISCESDMFEDPQMAFLQQFMEELYQECELLHSQQVYLFLNFEDSSQANEAELKIKQFQQALPNGVRYLCILPRLQSLNAGVIRNWLLTYVSPDQGRVEEIMELSFDNLPTPLSMRAAEKSIRQFIQQLNNQDHAIIKILN